MNRTALRRILLGSFLSFVVAACSNSPVAPTLEVLDAPSYDEGETERSTGMLGSGG
jgi:hypothetical protein